VGPRTTRMHSDVLIAAHASRPATIESRGAVAARRTGRDTVHLVSAAAGPLGGDTIHLRVTVEHGARLRLCSVAAMIVLPGIDGPASHIRWSIDVAGHLEINPQPTLVAARASHTSETRVRLTNSASVRIHERVQIGRSGEREGFWSGLLHADLDGAPLLRHRVELGTGSLADDEIAAPRAYVGEFRYPGPCTGMAGVTLELAGGGCLSSWQGDRLD
jgi:urease accessory protein